MSERDTKGICSAYERILNERTNIPTINTYYSLLSDYLYTQKGWSIENTQDEYGTKNIVNNGTVIGRIRRYFNEESNTLTLDFITSRPKTGEPPTRGLGLVKLVYKFDKEFVDKFHVNTVVIDPVHRVTKQQFISTYCRPTFNVKAVGDELVATRVH